MDSLLEHALGVEFLAVLSRGHQPCLNGEQGNHEVRLLARGARA
jgi:hypothetical protein